MTERIRSPFRWFRPLFLALGLLAAGAAALHAQDKVDPQSVRLHGVDGEVHVTAPAPLQVRSEVSGDHVKWVVACSSVAQASPGLEKIFKAVPGGIELDVPLASGPKLTWEVSGATFRWSSGAPESPNAGDPFATPLPPTYPIGPGDKLQVTVYNVDGMNESAVVDPAGMITFPVLDKVAVGGLTVTELQRKFETLLTQYVRDPQVSIQLLEYGSRYVNVLGNVHAPGRIPLKGAFRVLDAISQAGGFDEKSGDVEIQRRDASGKLQAKVLNKEDLLSASEKTNIYVLDQDVINVQPAKAVYVSGEVKSPGSLPYAKDMTLLRAITLAGGFTQWAKKDPVDILRDVDGKPTVVHVDASKIERGKAEDVPLKANDHVVVRERKFF